MFKLYLTLGRSLAFFCFAMSKSFLCFLEGNLSCRDEIAIHHNTDGSWDPRETRCGSRDTPRTSLRPAFLVSLASVSAISNPFRPVSGNKFSFIWKLGLLDNSDRVSKSLDPTYSHICNDTAMGIVAFLTDDGMSWRYCMVLVLVILSFI